MSASIFIHSALAFILAIISVHCTGVKLSCVVVIVFVLISHQSIFVKSPVFCQSERYTAPFISTLSAAKLITSVLSTSLGVADATLENAADVNQLVFFALTQ